MSREEFETRFSLASTELSPRFKEEIKKSNEYLGAERLVVCMEEAAEQTQAISKMYRNKPDRLNLIEEIGDIIICIESLKQIYSITDSEINKAINVKIDRGVN